VGMIPKLNHSPSQRWIKQTHPLGNQNINPSCASLRGRLAEMNRGCQDRGVRTNWYRWPKDVRAIRGWLRLVDLLRKHTDE